MAGTSSGAMPGSLHDVLLRDFQETGLYEFAEDLGMIQGGDIASLRDSAGPGPVPAVSSSPDLPAAGIPVGPVVGVVAASANNNNNNNSSNNNNSNSNLLNGYSSSQTMVRCINGGGGGGGGGGRALEHGAAEDPDSPDMMGRKRKRTQRPSAGDKSGKGLRHFSMKVCEKVESKGRTTYNEVADELVTEFSNPENMIASGDQQPYDEKNIRRRVYDALNVLMAMDIISKEKKDIQWKGLPSTSVTDAENIKADLVRLKAKLHKKQSYLQELIEQHTALKNLARRNERMYRGMPATQSCPGISVPFFLVQTKQHATVEVEMSETFEVFHFDFNDTPFELRDDFYILKCMGLHCHHQPEDGVVVASPALPAQSSPPQQLRQANVETGSPQTCAVSSSPLQRTMVTGFSAPQPPLPQQQHGSMVNIQSVTGSSSVAAVSSPAVQRGIPAAAAAITAPGGIAQSQPHAVQAAGSVMSADTSEGGGGEGQLGSLPSTAIPQGDPVSIGNFEEQR